MPGKTAHNTNQMNKIILTVLVTVLIGVAACQSNTMKMNIAEINKQKVMAFYQAIEEKNTDALVELFSEDCIHINPYASDILPEGARGKDGVRDYWAPVFDSFKGVKMTIEEIYAMEDPYIVYAKAKGKVILNDRPDYNNEYFMIFKFNTAGEIKHYTEVFNPIVALRSFLLLDKLYENERKN